MVATGPRTSILSPSRRGQGTGVGGWVWWVDTVMSRGGSESWCGIFPESGDAQAEKKIQTKIEKGTETTPHTIQGGKYKV